MTKISSIFWACSIGAALLTSCDANRSVASREQNSTRSRIASKADLERLLVTGMGTNEILLTLGEPRWIETVSTREQVWHHSLPPFTEDAAHATQVIGVVVGITNGNLAYWGCVSVGVPSSSIVRQEDVPLAGKSADSSTLRFFIVSSSSLSEGQFIDSARFPKLGYIGRIPDLSVSKLEEVTSEEREIPGSDGSRLTFWSFRIKLADEDGKKLASVTQANVSKQLLIMIGDEAVAAPTIMVPIETGSFVIECTERPLMERLKQNLASMQLQPH